MLSTAAPSTSLAALPTCARRRLRALPSSIVVSAAAAVGAGEGGSERFATSSSITDYLRYRRPSTGGAGGGGGGAGRCGGELQTAVVRFEKRFPWSLLNPFLHVDLVSTVHIADKEYFDRLQQVLEVYDCVLYEMVTGRDNLNNPNGPRAAKNMQASRRGFSILGFIQKKIARVLSLDYQLDCLDYDNKKWSHADLDYETFKQLQSERGESILTFAVDMTLKSTKALLQQTSMPEAVTAPVEEKSVIIGERNRVATEKINEAINCGYKRIAVLYGGRHMPDLGRQLREELNMVPADVQWVNKKPGTG